MLGGSSEYNNQNIKYKKAPLNSRFLVLELEILCLLDVGFQPIISEILREENCLWDFQQEGYVSVAYRK